MKEESVNKLMKALQLKHEPIGVKLLYYKYEFDEAEAEYVDKPLSLCMLAQMATIEKKVKADAHNIACSGAGLSLGIHEMTNESMSGRHSAECDLYSSWAIACQAADSVTRIPSRNHGVLLGSLSAMDDSDVVVLICDCKQMMRIAQGYVREYGPPMNLRTIANGAICSDMVVRPFITNDLNISFLCCGVRKYMNVTDGEMGVGMPIKMFDSLVDGVVQTIEATEPPAQKRKILESLTTPDELGVTLDKDNYYHYGHQSRGFAAVAKEKEAKAWADEK